MTPASLLRTGRRLPPAHRPPPPSPRYRPPPPSPRRRPPPPSCAQDTAPFYAPTTAPFRAPYLPTRPPPCPRSRYRPAPSHLALPSFFACREPCSTTTSRATPIEDVVALGSVVVARSGRCPLDQAGTRTLRWCCSGVRSARRPEAPTSHAICEVAVQAGRDAQSGSGMQMLAVAVVAATSHGIGSQHAPSTHVCSKSAMACALVARKWNLQEEPRGARTSNSAGQLGEIHVIVGPMFAGKTTMLLHRHRPWPKLADDEGCGASPPFVAPAVIQFVVSLSSLNFFQFIYCELFSSSNSQSWELTKVLHEKSHWSMHHVQKRKRGWERAHHPQASAPCHGRRRQPLSHTTISSYWIRRVLLLRVPRQRVGAKCITDRPLPPQLTSSASGMAF